VEIQARRRRAKGGKTKGSCQYHRESSRILKYFYIFIFEFLSEINYYVIAPETFTFTTDDSKTEAVANKRIPSKQFELRGAHH